MMLSRPRSIAFIFTAMILLAALLIPNVVLAEGEEPPVPDAPVGEVSPPAEEVQAPAPAETQAAAPVEELTTEDAAATEEIVVSEEAAPVSEDVAEVVELLAETSSVLLDEAGEPIPLASEEAVEALTASDPWFDAGGGVIVGYSSGGSCALGVTECHTGTANPIQAAISDVRSTGLTVHVEAGTYTGQVVIDHSVNLVGAGSASTFVNAPAALTVTVDGTQSIFVVTGATTLAEIAGFTIQGPVDGLDYGIMVRGGATAHIHDNTIQYIGDDPLSGNQYGVAILVGRQFTGQVGHAVIEDNEIRNYQKNGITVDNVGSTAEIRRNTITGTGPTLRTAQNGVQISRGATATIEDNIITLNDYTGAGWTAAGILLYQAGSGVSITGNQVAQNDNNIYVQSSNLALIQDNTVENAAESNLWIYMSNGTSILGNTFQGSVLYDNIDLYIVDGATIDGNQILNANYDGIWSGLASNVTITGNVFSGNGIGSGAADAAAVHLASTNTLAGFSIHGNSFNGNANGVNNENLVTAVDATGNWWGDGSGPLDNSAAIDSCGLTLDNPFGGGNAVSPCVIYESWLTSDPNAPSGQGGGDDTGGQQGVLPGTGGPLTNRMSVAGGQGVALECTGYDANALVLSNGDHVELPCPISGEAQLQQDAADVLPAPLPDGMTYVSAMQWGLAPDMQAVQTVGATIGVHFAIPNGQAGQIFNILHWDNGEWQKLGGLATADGYFEGSHAQTGLYAFVSE